MSFHATLWQIAVNGIFRKKDSLRSANKTKEFLDTLTGGREEIAARLNETLISTSASETEKKVALVLLLTPNLGYLNKELRGDWPSDWSTFVDLARIDWYLLTSDQHRDAYHLLSLVEIPSFFPAEDHLRRLAMDLAEEIEPAKANLLRQKFDSVTDVTTKAQATWREQR